MNREELILPAAVLLAAVMICACIAITDNSTDDTPAWAKEAVGKLNTAHGYIFYTDGYSSTVRNFHMLTNCVATATPDGICVVEHDQYYHFFPYDRIVYVMV